MSTLALHIEVASLASSAGLSHAATCAAMRAKIANPSELRYRDFGNEPLIGHRVELDRRLCGAQRLVHMCANAVHHCLEARPDLPWFRIPLLLCLAERQRPGRLSGLDNAVASGLVRCLPRLHTDQLAVFKGRAGITSALLHARELIAHRRATHVLVASTDSLLHHASLLQFEEQGRLLTSLNSDGFIPGEGAGALVVAAHTGARALKIVGLGYSHETAHVESGEPLRAEGLRTAIQRALTDANGTAADFDFSVSDAAGEQYAFKESSLAVSRTLRVRKASFEFWQPAETVGNCGASLPLMCLALADDAMAKGYAAGNRVLLHFGDDHGERAAVFGIAD